MSTKNPNQKATHRRSAFEILKPLIQKYMKPYWGQLAVALVFMVVAAAATASFAKLLQPVLDKAMIGVQHNKEPASVIVPLAGLIFLSFALRGIATYIHTIKMSKISQSIVGDIQRDVFSHFMTLDLGFFHRHPSGQLVSRVTNDVNVMRAAVTETLTGIGSNLLTLIFLVAVMIMQDWRLSLVTFTIFPFASGLVAVLGRRLRKVSKTIQGETAYLMVILTQIFQGIRQVQAYGMQDFERKRAGDAVNSVRQLNIKAARISNLSTPINEILVGAVVFGVIVYGGYRIAHGELTPGGLMSFIAAFSLAYEPMKRLAKLNSTLQVGLGAAERVEDMMTIRPSITDRPNAHPLNAQNPTISFRDVTFSYAASNQFDKNDPLLSHFSEGQIAEGAVDLSDKEGGIASLALNHITIDIKPNQMTALVGASGGGKTTLMSLILRFYDPQGGQILINDIDLCDVTLSSLRAHMALVSQDITIFDGTIASNIAYGLPHEVHLDDIREAACAAAADGFISALPNGYDTRVGENGVLLSGGQRQRISLARAILRNAPILLLDEATSALDNESERTIQKTLESLQQGRTTLVIAHRLSTVQRADKIIVMDKGRVVEQGTHASLMAHNGVYARMFLSGQME